MKFKDRYPHLDNIEKYDETLDISYEKLTSLEGCPKEITGIFYCNNNQLTSLVGGPEKVTSVYNCFENKLTSLEGITSYISGSLTFKNNPIESIAGIHKQIEYFGGVTIFISEFTTKGLLDLFRLNAPNLKFIHGNNEIKSIFDKYFLLIRKDEMNKMEAMLNCQSELIENNLEKYTEF